MIEKLKQRFDMNKLLAIIIVLIVCLSCGYHYIDYQIRMEKTKMMAEEIRDEFKQIRWEKIYSIIGALNREGKLHSELVAIILKRDIQEAYPDMKILQQKFNNKIYSDRKFNEIIMNTINKNSFVGESSSKNGILITCDDRVLYNFIITNDRFDMSFEDFISKNYNDRLARSAFNSIMVLDDEIKLIEPKRPVSQIIHKHIMIETSSIENLKNVYMTEGIEGLSGYLLINPYFITSTGDIFGIPDFNHDGSHSNNHKVIVMSYLSIYDIINKYYSESFDNILSLENDAIQHNEIELMELYYSSIKTIMLHTFLIILILIITNYYRHNKRD